MIPWRFVLTGLGFALLATAAGALVLRLAGGRPGPRGLGLAFLVLFFLGLTQLPFPDAATMTCPQPGVAPRLDPAHIFRRAADIVQRPRLMLRTSFLAAVMNFVLCAGIGAALALWRPVRLRAALGLGLGLTALVELTQITAFWGLYPCPWRTFDVSDLILNLSGVVAGFGLMRRWRPADRPERVP